MVDFRKSLLLAAMALAVGVGTASAQSGSCIGTTGAPPILRSQGIEELTGQIVITCTGLPDTGSTINIAEFIQQSTITSRPSEAFAVVTANPATPPGVLTFGVVSGNSVSFNGLQILGTTATIIIGGVRINANSVVGAGTVVPISAQLAVSNGSLPLQTNTFVVGLIENGITATVTAGTLDVAACTLTPGTITAGAAGSQAAITVTEGFPTAFKVQFPGTAASPDSETGPYVAGGGNTFLIPDTTTAVQNANSATQFSLTFAGIPSGLTFYVPVTIGSFVVGSTATAPDGGGVANLVQGPGSTLAVTGAFIPGLPQTGAFVAVTANTTLYYNVTSANPSVQETYPFPVYPSGSVSGTPTLSVSFAPNPGQLTGTPVPLFAPSTGLTGGLLPSSNINACQTSLLFPFITNQAGFDTGVSIAYTGADPFGTSTTTQGGAAPACQMYFYGVGAPATLVAPLSVPAGGEGHTTISAIAPGFQGYAIAVCNFTLAHGFAFITDGFMGPGKGLSEGYLPLVLGNNGARGGTAEGQSIPSTAAGASGAPENLNH